MIGEKQFIEHNLFNSNYYGTAKKEIQRINCMGKICILELDINGANQTHKDHFSANYIAILPPSTDTLKERLNTRGTENPETIENRVKIGIKELEEIKDSQIFNFKIFNEELEKAYGELVSCINSLYPDLKN